MSKELTPRELRALNQFKKQLIQEKEGQKEKAINFEKETVSDQERLAKRIRRIVDLHLRGLTELEALFEQFRYGLSLQSPIFTSFLEYLANLNAQEQKSSAETSQDGYRLERSIDHLENQFPGFKLKFIDDLVNQADRIQKELSTTSELVIRFRTLTNLVEVYLNRTIHPQIISHEVIRYCLQYSLNYRAKTEKHTVILEDGRESPNIYIAFKDVEFLLRNVFLYEELAKQRKNERVQRLQQVKQQRQQKNLEKQKFTKKDQGTRTPPVFYQPRKHYHLPKWKPYPQEFDINSSTSTDPADHELDVEVESEAYWVEKQMSSSDPADQGEVFQNETIQELEEVSEAEIDEVSQEYDGKIRYGTDERELPEFQQRKKRKSTSKNEKHPKSEIPVPYLQLKELLKPVDRDYILQLIFYTLDRQGLRYELQDHQYAFSLNELLKVAIAHINQQIKIMNWNIVSVYPAVPSEWQLQKRRKEIQRLLEEGQDVLSRDVPINTINDRDVPLFYRFLQRAVKICIDKQMLIKTQDEVFIGRGVEEKEARVKKDPKDLELFRYYIANTDVWDLLQALL